MPALHPPIHVALAAEVFALFLLGLEHEPGEAEEGEEAGGVCHHGEEDG